jgi:hypothetical protein
MELNMDLDAETFKKFQKFLAMKETIDKYKRMEEKNNKRKMSAMKYAKSEKGKARRREASRNYYARKRAEKLKSLYKSNAVSN